MQPAKRAHSVNDCAVEVVVIVVDTASVSMVLEDADDIVVGDVVKVFTTVDEATVLSGSRVDVLYSSPLPSSPLPSSPLPSSPLPSS